MPWVTPLVLCRLLVRRQQQVQVRLLVQHQVQEPSSSVQVFPPSLLFLPNLANGDGSQSTMCATTSLLLRLLAQASTQ
jgi:hypothetical protein